MPAPDTLPATRGDAMALALGAYEDLVLVAETVADEWTYVSGLAAAGRARLTRAAGTGIGLPLARDRAAAILAAAAEARLVTDPHRSIDWLSTFPAVVELAFRGAPDGAGASGAAGAAGGSASAAADRSSAGPAARTHGDGADDAGTLDPVRGA